MMKGSGGGDNPFANYKSFDEFRNKQGVSTNSRRQSQTWDLWKTCKIRVISFKIIFSYDAKRNSSYSNYQQNVNQYKYSSDINRKISSSSNESDFLGSFSGYLNHSHINIYIAVKPLTLLVGFIISFGRLSSIPSINHIRGNFERPGDDLCSGWNTSARHPHYE